MPNLIRSLCAAALLFSLGAAHALTPSLGIWWNPNESGRGYELDRQGGTMSLAMYAYDATGRSTWYLGAGPFDLNQTVFETDAFNYSGGQCFGCAYSTPLGTEFGTVSIDFSDADHGVLTYPGGSVPIEHFNYGYASKQDQLLGYWSFSAVIGDGDSNGPQTLGEFVLFYSHFTAGDGTVYVSGAGFADPSVTALGSYSAVDDSFTVDVTLPDGTLHHYDQLQGSDNVLIGQSSYGVDSTPTSAVATRVEYYAPQLQGQPNAAASMFDRPAHTMKR